MPSRITRRSLLRTAGKTAALAPILRTAIAAPDTAPLNGVAGIDRVTVLGGKTYLRGWAGYGDPPHPGRGFRRPDPNAPPPPPPPTGPAATVTWSKESGPGTVTFADAKAPVTTATFSAPGAYVLKLTADNG